MFPGAIIETTPQPQLPHAQPANGFPLGEPLLYLRGIRKGIGRNIACTIENVYDQPLLRFQSANNMPHGVWKRYYDELRFVALNPDGSVRYFITRPAAPHGQWETQMIQVHDGGGRDLGRLRTTAPVAQFSKANGATLGFEYNRQWLGVTEVRQFQWGKKPVPIFDAEGGVIAQIRSSVRYSSRYTHFTDFLLDCPSAVPHPIPELMVVALFNQYLYDRLQHPSSM